MTRSTYNDNKEYELMAQIINDQMGPYDETAREDITQILKYCYIFTADEGKPIEHTASDLARTIVAYLSGSWNVPNFEQDAIDWHNSPTEAQDTAEGVHTVDVPDSGQLLIP